MNYAEEESSDFDYFKVLFMRKYAELLADKYISVDKTTRYKCLEKELFEIKDALNLTNMKRIQAEKGEDLIDLGDGPLSKKELANAVEVLGEHLRMNPDLYRGYQSNIAQAIYDEFDNSVVDEELQDFEEFCNKAAKRFMKRWLTNIEEHSK